MDRRLTPRPYLIHLGDLNNNHINLMILSVERCIRADLQTTECDKYVFLTKYEYRILFGFPKSPNTEYQILFGIEKIQIPNTEYYLVSRKFKYQIRIVLFGLTIQIQNTKYQIVYKILEKN